MAKRDLNGARAIVTGASSGIGRALAGQLAEAGTHLVLTARRADRLRSLADELTPAGVDIQTVPGDITSSDLRRRLVDAARTAWHGLDIVINNAGLGAIGDFATAEEQRLRQVMEVNFFAPVELIRESLSLLGDGVKPLIVNVGSVLGHRAVPRKSEYCASKFAMHGFSDSLRAELAERGIDVLLASPSTTASEFFDQVIDTDDSERGLRRSADSPAAVARRVVKAMRQGRHEVIMTAGGKFLVWLDRLFPTWANRLVARHTR